MSDLKKNIYYSYLLTAANYVFPLIVFPYVTRTLGAPNIGLCNWVDSIINYYVMFSMMGISVLGIREIAGVRESRDELNKTFSALVYLNTITTLIALAVLIVITLTVKDFRNYSTLFYIGAAKLATNLFQIEWYYKGIEDFKYIARRSISVKTIYTISVILFVTDVNDYIVYFSLTIASVVITNIINILHSRATVSIVPAKIPYTYLRPFFTLGLYILLNAMYSTFNVGYLGIVHSKAQVGYYTTVIRIFGIILTFYTAWATAMMPRIAALFANKDREGISKLIDKSFSVLYTIIFPLAILGFAFAPEIIFLIGGNEFAPAVPLLRMAFFILPVCGIEQVLVYQLLMPIKADKQVLYNSVISATIGLVVGQYLIRHFASWGSIFTFILIELSVMTASIIAVKKLFTIKILSSSLWKNLISSVPYILLCFVTFFLTKNLLNRCLIVFPLSLLWFGVSNRYLIRDPIILKVFNHISNFFHH